MKTTLRRLFGDFYVWPALVIYMGESSCRFDPRSHVGVRVSFLVWSIEVEL
jgi:hypothetical protein